MQRCQVPGCEREADGNPYHAPALAGAGPPWPAFKLCSEHADDHKVRFGPDAVDPHSPAVRRATREAARRQWGG